MKYTTFFLSSLAATLFIASTAFAGSIPVPGTSGGSASSTFGVGIPPSVEAHPRQHHQRDRQRRRRT